MNYTQKILFLVFLVLLVVNYDIILDGDLPIMAVNLADVHSDPTGAFENPATADDRLYEEMLSQAGKQWGVGGASIQTFMDQISKHESKGDASAVQKSQGWEDKVNKTGGYIFDGPGRGKYQFETDEGSGAGRVAMSRLRNIMSDYSGDLDDNGKSGKVGSLYKSGREMPGWMTSDESVDASKLSSKQQDIMFLANYMQHPTARIDKDTLGSDQGRKDFYSNMHWAGTESEREGMGNKFATSQGWQVPGEYDEYSRQ